MSVSAIPFNIELLQLNKDLLTGLRPVKVLDNFDNTGVNFHDDGLFSAITFGKVGTDRRSKAFAYLDIKISILHPLVYRILTDIHAFYGEIMAGRCYAVWDTELKDFVKVSDGSGSTGYAFFIKHWKDIVIEKNASAARNEKIDLINKYKDSAENTHIVVLPAGLRDLREESDGRVSEDEVNAIYRKILAISNAIPEAAVKNNPEVVNTARFNMQMAFNDLFEYFRKMIDGKKKLIMGRWAARRVFNSTRNVLTAMDPTPKFLGEDGSINLNTTIVGLYQAMKALYPVAIYCLQNSYLSKVFHDPSQPAVLVNKKTLKREEVSLKTAYFDKWTTEEGLGRLLNTFSDDDVRHRPIDVNGRWLSLTYLGPDGTFKLISDVDSIPDTRDKAHVHPTTYCELFYAAVYHLSNNYPAFVTRYPIAGIGSTYPSFMLIKTTVNTEVRNELTDTWVVDPNKQKAYHWPILGEAFVNSLVPHISKIKGMGADYDGDTGSLTCTYSQDSIDEVTHFLKTKQAYIGTDGGLLASAGTETVEFVMYNLSEV